MHIRQLSDAVTSKGMWIAVLFWCLMALLFIVAVRVGWLLYCGRLSEIWGLLQPFALIMSVLAVVLVADRGVKHQELLHADNNRRDIVKNLHHAAYVTIAMQDRVHYVCHIFDNKQLHSLVTLTNVSKQIVASYQLLTQKEIFEYTDQKCVDLIQSMAGKVFGLETMVETMRVRHGAGATMSQALSDAKERGPVFKSLMKLDQELGSLHEQIGVVRDKALGA